MRFGSEVVAQRPIDYVSPFAPHRRDYASEVVVSIPDVGHRTFVGHTPEVQFTEMAQRYLDAGYTPERAAAATAHTWERAVAYWALRHAECGALDGQRIDGGPFDTPIPLTA